MSAAAEWRRRAAYAGGSGASNTDLFASLPDPLPEPAGMDDVEDARLNRAVLLAIRMRAGIVRDNYRREIDDVHNAEGPARLDFVLGQLFAGLEFYFHRRAPG